MAFGVSANRSLASRGPSPGFRFALYAILSVTLMFLDQRGEWLRDVRYVLQAAAYPIQLAVSSPSAAWRWMSESMQTRDALRAENERLRARQRQLEIRTLRYDALARENAELRGLRDALPPVADKWLVAEVVNAQPNSLRQSVLLNRGTRNGVFKSQAVLDDFGLVGQTTHVGPWSAEVILITDTEHELPVQIERTGLRTIAVGTGTGLALPYLPANADVKPGDLLITSGLGGVFPQGYPVARVTAVQRDAVQPLAQVRAQPLARLDRMREVMLVWFRDDHPAAPGSTSGADLKAGNPNVQPQAAPPKPKPSAPADSEKAAGTPGGVPAKPAAAPAAGGRAQNPSGASGSEPGRAPASGGTTSETSGASAPGNTASRPNGSAPADNARKPTTGSGPTGATPGSGPTPAAPSGEPAIPNTSQSGPESSGAAGASATTTRGAQR
ncbi:MAG TPA: rod shape-determining protein MreC [Steroidobacteraceae bacterium]|nr:rod shape-determining protein MreC [Steroidobacteraceae bacterium]